MTALLEEIIAELAQINPDAPCPYREDVRPGEVVVSTFSKEARRIGLLRSRVLQEQNFDARILEHLRIDFQYLGIKPPQLDAQQAKVQQLRWKYGVLDELLGEAIARQGGEAFLDKDLAARSDWRIVVCPAPKPPRNFRELLEMPLFSEE